MRLAALVVLQIHRSPAVELVPDKPEVRRDANDIADFPGVVGRPLGKAALRLEDRGESPPEAAVESGGFRFDKWSEVVKEVPRHPIDGKPLETDPGELGEVHEESVLDPLRVSVDAYGRAEEVFEALSLSGRVRVRHRVCKPSLNC